MISESLSAYFSALWDAIAPLLGNHLWQSTLFAAAAGLLTLALRKHHARTRYWLWFAASVKFLIPFFLLSGLGSHLAWSRSSAANPGLYFALGQMSQPFTQSAVRGSSVAAPSPASASLPHFLPLVIALWLCGFLVVLLVWSARWRRVSAAIKSAIPLCEGREVGALRRLEGSGGVRKPIEVLLSSASLEPGIFGIARPVLIWPEGISKRLEDAQLNAILAHEVWHVRRRDNLFAALHMLVEALFWFHPLVWWLGARLVEERERACDEEVVELGSDRQVYAESILKVCEFCLGSPLACVSGVTGADLKQRMVHIMSDRILHKLDFARKLLLSTAASLALALPILFGVLNATPSRAQSQDATASLAAAVYQSVSITPHQSADNAMHQEKVMFSLKNASFVANGATLQSLIRLAYHVQNSQISGGPDWLNTEKFDVEAKLDPAVADQMSKLSDVQQLEFDNQHLLQSLLSDHFQLRLHPEAKNLPVYELVIAEGGSKLQQSKGPSRMHMEPGELTSQGVPLALLADQLSHQLGRTVVDKTGLRGNYIFSLRWTPAAGENVFFKSRVGPGEPPSLAPPAAAPATTAPPLMTALEEQLGLKLESQTDPVQVLVIDHAESPSEN